MALRLLRGAAALLLAGAVALVIAAPGQAGGGTGKCRSSGQAVINQQQQVIYFVAAGPEYRGCYKRTGRVTRLITKGEDYATEGAVAHGTHATVLERKPPAPGAAGIERVITNWNVKTGKPFAALTIQPETNETIMVDDVLDDPVTAVTYIDEGKRVVDVVYDKGTKRLSGDGSVKSRSVKVAGRKVTWVEGGRKRSKRV
jgi:hypothetical protein